MRVVLAALVAVLGWQEVAGQDSQNQGQYCIGLGQIQRQLNDLLTQFCRATPASHEPTIIHSDSPVSRQGSFSGRSGVAPVWDECPSANFSVERAKPNGDSNTIISPAKIEFQNVVVNNGAWSTIDNVFTAPCDGLFNFSFDAQSSEYFIIQLFKNRRAQVTAYGSNQQPVQESNTLNLEIGDRAGGVSWAWVGGCVGDVGLGGWVCGCRGPGWVGVWVSWAWLGGWVGVVGLAGWVGVVGLGGWSKARRPKCRTCVCRAAVLQYFPRVSQNDLVNLSCLPPPPTVWNQGMGIPPHPTPLHLMSILTLYQGRLAWVSTVDTPAGTTALTADSTFSIPTQPCTTACCPTPLLTQASSHP
ncbi:hypothetical protein Pcinc_021091 [Petrolisthes cinctipes]|uniref:C1q domain-containing protein n=1 Tax=Petrolisthes cinctipes TaxID=88211 RepID=A0AAE1FHW3_PETCI|nr:hypothetical protein Pcinc_021091 [Petrolisthes cinctipes]